MPIFDFTSATGSSSNTQVLFNSSGSVAGSSILTWDGTNFTIGTPLLSAVRSTVSGNVRGLSIYNYVPTTGVQHQTGFGIYQGYASGNTDDSQAFEISHYNDGTGTLTGVTAGVKIQLDNYSTGAIEEGRGITIYSENSGGGTYTTYTHLYLRPLVTATYGTARAINYADLFIVDSLGKLTVPSAGLTIGSALVTLSGNFTTTGAFNPTFAIPSSSTWTFPSGGGTLLTSVTETTLSFTDITTADVSTTKHGLTPKLPNDATKYLDGTGVWSVPAGGGGGGTPGGSDTQVQFNDAGAFGGDAGLTYNKTSNVLTNTGGQFVSAGGTVTASTPLLDLAQTWNSAGVTFTGIKLTVTNTASAAASKHLDLQVGSTTYFAVQGLGTSFEALQLGAAGDKITNLNGFGFDIRSNFNGSQSIVIGGAGVSIGSAGTLAFTDDTGGGSGTQDVILRRDAANALAVRRTTNAQVFRWYKTFSDSSNYERGALQTASGLIEIAAETAGTGGDDLDVKLTPAGAGLVRFGTHDATPLTISGFLSIKDAGGTIRKLAVVT